MVTVGGVMRMDAAPTNALISTRLRLSFVMMPFQQKCEMNHDPGISMQQMALEEAG
jgi:hypothetical protein